MINIALAKEEDLKELITIYKSAFSHHNIFEKSEAEILEYLKDRISNILIAKIDGKVVGGILVRLKAEAGTHSLWRLNHLAAAEKGKGIGEALVKAAEEKINGEKKGTAKVELGVCDESVLEFYKKLGYVEEGQLTSHYRHGELVFSLGKELS